MNERKQVLIVGGGFAGLSAAEALRGAAVDVTLIGNRNFHLFRPLLHQVATGGLSPADIASPLRGILARQTNVRAIQGTVTNIDLGEVASYDATDMASTAAGNQSHPCWR